MERKSLPLHPLSPGLLPVTELFTFTTAQQRLIKREPISSPQACLTRSAPIRRCYLYSLSFFELPVACRLFWGGKPDSVPCSSRPQCAVLWNGENTKVPISWGDIRTTRPQERFTWEGKALFSPSTAPAAFAEKKSEDFPLSSLQAPP